MIAKSLSRIWCAWMLTSVLTLPAFGQITQNHPEICGKASFIPLPPNISAISNGDAHTDLFLKVNGSNTKIEMGGVYEVEQVCPLSMERLLVFGLLDPGAYLIYVVDEFSGNVLAEIDARNPRVSPDQHWLATRMLHPPSSELTVTDRYFLYDLTDPTVGNSYFGPEPGRISSSGRVMYPALSPSAPAEFYGVAREHVHDFQADAFFWSGDSKSVVFADEVQGKLSIVWVRIGPEGEPTAHVHPVTTSQVCENLLGGLTLSNASFVLAGDKVSQILVDFRVPHGGTCEPNTLVLSGSDFERATMEVHAPRPPKKPSVGVEIK